MTGRRDARGPGRTRRRAIGVVALGAAVLLGGCERQLVAGLDNDELLIGPSAEAEAALVAAGGSCLVFDDDKTDARPPNRTGQIEFFPIKRDGGGQYYLAGHAKKDKKVCVNTTAVLIFKIARENKGRKEAWIHAVQITEHETGNTIPAGEFVLDEGDDLGGVERRSARTGDENFCESLQPIEGERRSLFIVNRNKTPGDYRIRICLQPRDGSKPFEVDPKIRNGGRHN